MARATARRRGTSSKGAKSEATYRLAAYVEDQKKSVHITNLWESDKDGCIATGSSKAQYLEPIADALDGACNKGKQVRFVIFDYDPDKFSEKNGRSTRRARREEPESDDDIEDEEDAEY